VSWGHEIFRRRFGGVEVIQTFIPPHTVIPNHGHVRLMLFSIIAGDLAVDSPTGRLAWTPFAPGLDPLDLHQGVGIGPAGLLVVKVSFDDSLVERLGYSKALFGKGDYRVDPSARSAMLTLSLAANADSAGTESIATEFLSEFDPRIWRLDSHCPEWLHRAKDYLHDRFREPLGLAQVSAEVAVDPTHLARTFRSRYGSTVSGYLRNLRTVEAVRLMLSEGKTATEAAIEAGFHDLAHFTKSCRRISGASPVMVSRLRKIAKAAIL
jgi:AraC-like DNA-binding protein